MLFNASFNPTPYFSPTRVYLLGEPTSLLVVANTHPPLSLVCQQLPHPLLAFPPFHTLLFPTVQLTLFTQMMSAIPVVLVWNNYFFVHKIDYKMLGKICLYKKLPKIMFYIFLN
jgi:hypothetical protein